MKQLNPVSRSAAAESVVQTIDTCMIPVATYRSDIWWPGISRSIVRGMVTSQTSFHCKLIDRAIRLASRAAPHVLKTIPNEIMHREGVIPPARILSENNRIRLASRFNMLNSTYPHQIRASMCPNIRTVKYRSS